MAKDTTIEIRVSQAEKEAIVRMANEEGLKVSAWLRQLAMAEVARWAAVGGAASKEAGAERERPATAAVGGESTGGGNEPAPAMELVQGIRCERHKRLRCRERVCMEAEGKDA